MDFKYKIGDKVRITEDFYGINVKNLVGGTHFTWDERILCQIEETCNPPRIEKNGIATIVFWNDGTKTVVKRGADEPDSDYAAFTAALAIKTFGSNSAVKRIVAGTKEQESKKKRKSEVIDLTGK